MPVNKSPLPSRWQNVPPLDGVLGNNICRGGQDNQTCFLEVKDHQRGVQCELCSCWYHVICLGLKRGAYNALQNYPTLSYMCDECKKCSNQGKLQKTTSEVSVQCGSDDTGEMRLDSASGSPRPLALQQVETRVNQLECALAKHSKLVCESFKAQEKLTQEHAEKVCQTILEGLTTQRTFAEVVKSPSTATTTHPSNNSSPDVSEAPPRISGSGDPSEYRQMIREELLWISDPVRPRFLAITR